MNSLRGKSFSYFSYRDLSVLDQDFSDTSYETGADYKLFFSYHRPSKFGEYRVSLANIGKTKDRNMEKSAVQNASFERRLEKACTYVEDLWFPVNSDLLKSIQSGLVEGGEFLDPDRLIETLSEDFSLFTYVLKETLKMLRAEGVNIKEDESPVGLMRRAGLERLKKILEMEPRNISRHSLEALSEDQRGRLEEVLVATSAAETLAPKFEIEADIGYSGALLRQLGYLFIAWNYPTVYREAMSSLTKERGLDLAITEKLGFSPLLLAARMLEKWGMPKGYVNNLFLGDPVSEEDQDEAEILSYTRKTLARLCSIGESLARANDPKHYPSARADWEEAQVEIAEKLGPDGIFLIQEKLTEHSEHYLSLLPEMFSAGLVLDPELHIASKDRDDVLARNPYICRCEESIRSKFMELYLSIPKGQVSEVGLSTLLKGIVSSAGFSGGMVYTIDPGVMMLIPQAKMGVPKLREQRAVDYSIVSCNSDSIAVAFRSDDPVIEYRTSKDGDVLVGVSGIIGYSNRVGVLYLEIPEPQFIDREREVIYHFQALSQAFNDALNLR